MKVNQLSSKYMSFVYVIFSGLDYFMAALYSIHLNYLFWLGFLYFFIRAFNLFKL